MQEFDRMEENKRICKKAAIRRICDFIKKTKEY
jgi:hypothetical protein